jgi:hypothetical protein
MPDLMMAEYRAETGYLQVMLLLFIECSVIYLY